MTTCVAYQVVAFFGALTTALALFALGLWALKTARLISQLLNSIEALEAENKRLPTEQRHHP